MEREPVIILCMCVSVALLGVFALCDLSSAYDLSCLGVVVFDLPMCNLFINVLIHRPNILTIIIVTLIVNQSMCAEKENFHLM